MSWFILIHFAAWTNLFGNDSNSWCHIVIQSEAVVQRCSVKKARFPLVVGVGGGVGGGGLADWGGDPPTTQNFDKSPLTKILSLPINVPLHLVWHSLPSVSQSPII